MTSTISKRQQARNERILQELIRTIPGNDRCADCGSRNPGWASWSLGVFLCMRCAALHRKLGTHISKVKSLSMDTWSNEQVDNMKSLGNTVSNKLYNPHNVKPPIPLDIDEADSVMERFIRQKYESKNLSGSKSARKHSTSTSFSSEDEPPPLPPKTGKKFGLGLGLGLRSASSTYPFPQSETRRGSIPAFRNGSVSSNPGLSIEDSFDSKLQRLRDMGFMNESRNETILKGLNGNMEKAIESLIRLGEGSMPVSRNRTPVPTSRKSSATAASAPTPKQESTNPFDRLTTTAPTSSNGLQVLPPLPHPPLSQQVSGPYVQQQKTSGSYNPFEQQPVPLEQSFQNLSMSQSLFPHSTGGYPSQSAAPPHLQQQNPYTQSLTPPITLAPQYPAQVAAATVAQPQSANGSFNPFFASTVQPSNPYASQVQPQQPQPQPQPTNPWSSQLPMPQADLSQQQYAFQASQPQPQPAQIQQYLYTQSVVQQQQQQPPYYVPQNPYYVQQARPQVDKASILSLYNAPQLAPTTTLPPQQQQQQQQQPMQYPPQVVGNGMPADAGSRNPFLSSQPQVQAEVRVQGQQVSSAVAPGMVGMPGADMSARSRHITQESIDVMGGGLGWGGWNSASGRHSPDAFASLSARLDGQ